MARPSTKQSPAEKTTSFHKSAPLSKELAGTRPNTVPTATLGTDQEATATSSGEVRRGTLAMAHQLTLSSIETAMAEFHAKANLKKSAAKNKVWVKAPSLTAKKADLAAA